MPARSKLTVTHDPGPITRSIAALNRRSLLVGIPDTAAERKLVDGEKDTPPSNATIGYAMEFGLPEENVPARPFLIPGMRNAMPAITKGMEKAAVAAFLLKKSDVDAGFDEAGLAAVASVQRTMQAGPFAPLAQSTIEARARRKYADTGRLVGTATARNARSFLKLQAEGTPDAVLHDAGLATPLLDTRSLFRSVTYIKVGGGAA